MTFLACSVELRLFHVRLQLGMVDIDLMLGFGICRGKVPQSKKGVYAILNLVGSHGGPICCLQLLGLSVEFS